VVPSSNDDAAGGNGDAVEFVDRCAEQVGRVLGDSAKHEGGTALQSRCRVFAGGGDQSPAAARPALLVMRS
jgi:hypothetical protein